MDMVGLGRQGKWTETKQLELLNGLLKNNKTHLNQKRQ